MTEPEHDSNCFDEWISPVGHRHQTEHEEEYVGIIIEANKERERMMLEAAENKDDDEHRKCN